MENINKSKIKIIPIIIKILSILFLIYIQFKFVIIQMAGSSDFLKYFNFIIVIIKLGFVLYIIYKFENPSYKALLIIFIICFPIPGIILYIVFGNTKISKHFQKKLDNEYINSQKYIKYDNEICKEIEEIDKLKYNQVNYLYNTNGLPIYRNSYVEYFDIGEKYFESMVNDVSKAKKYIFIESFSITEGVMWNRLFDMLKQKVSKGIKVYLIVDGINNFEKYPKDFKKSLDEVGIKYRIFNSSVIKINKYLNYRDHRKIVVIDGEITYTGGINIGDEYINLYKKFGHLKDVGIKILGEASLSYILIFIRMWNLSGDDKKLEYKNFISNNKINTNINKGYIMPYCDGPDNGSNPAQNLYIQIINTAKNYLYITTPYLILDNDVVTAFKNTAKSGVDIRIITPYIPDKKFVHLTTRSFYQVLLESGVKIYEYKPGFIHSKVFVSDDELATVGSINLDFRGLYFHYECGNWIYKTGIEKLIKYNFLQTQEKSIQINLDEWKKRGLLKKLLEKILIMISPLI
ncbi:MAG: cardiolipin synthase [Clostridia bacterium]|nr:cardiolipin synthase [Clostridia bacterium]MDD4386295.1 cardiolipin synthase [Clostridia bacterium]